MTSEGGRMTRSRSGIRKPKCFVIMPFGQKGSPEEDRFLKVYTYIIKKPIEDAGFECERGDQLPEFGPIPEQIIKKLKNADLVVADLSGRNPNVFYELGHRHALNRPVIPISDDVRGLPFNVAAYRTVPYQFNEIESVEQCKESIKKYALQIKRSLRVSTASPEETLSTASMLDVDSHVMTGFANVYQMLSDLTQTESYSSPVRKQVAGLETMLSDKINELKDIRTSIADLSQPANLVAQTISLGLMSVYPSRLHAIDAEFYRIMREETTGISVVGSTIFGLRGYATQLLDILNLLQEKVQHPAFQLRILLTHWDHISYRQDQEKTKKNIARYVISKELKQAVESLHDAELDRFVKFYRGSPTCFTIVCEGQKLMLVNPYPYEREAFNSWTAVFREAPGEIYSNFKAYHVDGPWANPELAVAMDHDSEAAITKRFEEDLARVPEDTRRMVRADREAAKSVSAEALN